MNPASTETPLPYPQVLIDRMKREAEQVLQGNGVRSNTIFPTVEALLGFGTYQKALGFVADRAIMSIYRSTIDFLFCEMFPKHAEACLAYYGESARQAKELLSIDEVRRCEHAMFCALVMAAAIHEDLRDDASAPRVRWSTIVSAARELAAFAPPAAATLQ